MSIADDDPTTAAAAALAATQESSEPQPIITEPANQGTEEPHYDYHDPGAAEGSFTPPELLPILAAMTEEAVAKEEGALSSSAVAAAEEDMYSMPISREAENAVVDAVILQQEQHLLQRQEQLLQLQHQQQELQQQEATSISNGIVAPSSNSMQQQQQRRTNEAGQRIGRWSLDEKLLFLYGLQKFGKGRWKKISTYVPDRSLVQIKSHAQKVLKRLENGENVFRRLEENCSRLHYVVSQIHCSLGLEPPSVVLHAHSPNTTVLVAEQGQQRPAGTTTTTALSISATASTAIEAPPPTKRRRRNKKKSDGNDILAASALCQLGGPHDSSGSSAASVADGEEVVLAPADDNMDAHEKPGTLITAGDASAATIQKIAENLTYSV